MASQRVRRKLAIHGAKAAFARAAGVSRTTVTLWLRGERLSPRLDKLARTWRPNEPAAEMVASAPDNQTI